MSFYINHFMQIWLLPPGIVILLSLISYILPSKMKTTATILYASSLTILWLLSTPYIAQLLVDSLQNRYPVLSPQHLKKDSSVAIVVLEAGVNLLNPEYGTPIVSSETLTRLRYAAFLSKKTTAPILVSGNDPSHPDIDQTIYMAQALKDYFQASTKWYENKGYNTALEGKYTAEILHKANIRKIYLVTRAIHIPRSMYAFKNKSLEVIAAPTGFINFNTYLNHIDSILPSADALNVSSMCLREYIGLVWYALFYSV